MITITRYEELVRKYLSEKATYSEHAELLDTSLKLLNVYMKADRERVRIFKEANKWN